MTRSTTQRATSNVVPLHKGHAFRVEHDIDIPRKCDANRRYPFIDMAPGDSFIVHCEAAGKTKVQNQLARNIWRFRQTHGKQYEFTTRFMGDGVRCWRVK